MSRRTFDALVLATLAGAAFATTVLAAPADSTAGRAPVRASARTSARALPTHVAPAPEAAGPGGSAARLKAVTLHIFNRVFPGFHDKVVAKPNVEFRIGDTDYTARLIRFVPDFDLNLGTHAIANRSGEPKNPAFQIEVKREGKVRDTTWAFFNIPPHYTVRNQLGFVATRVEFTNRPVLESQDSLAIRLRQQEGGAH